MMPILEIIRLEESHKWGTFGVLRIQKQVFCVTLEPADVVNKKFISSIPAQQYRCKRCHSPRFGETFMVMHVPNRKDVLFHAGNWAYQTEGCIILAQHYGKLKGERAVLNSGATFRRFMELLKGRLEAHLTIAEHYG